MSSTSTQICNMAIAHIGIGKRIANIESEQSAEANACRTFYEPLLEKILSDFDWPFATKFADLGLVEENPTDEWAYAYRYPSDCLKLRRIPSGLRTDNRQSRIPFKVGQDTSGGLIYTDKKDAQMEYTLSVSNVSRFPPDFALAFSYLLAAMITPSLCGSDRMKIAPGLYQLYESTISDAKASAMNEEQPDQVPESEMIRSREGVYFEDPSTRFIPV